MHQRITITEEELEFWLDGEKYTFSYNEENATTTADPIAPTDYIIKEQSNKSDVICNKCGECFPYAEPKEKGKFRCWGCSNNG